MTVKVLLNWPHVLLISGLEAVPRKGALVPPQRYWCEKRLQEIHNTFYFILFVSSLDILKMLFTYGGFQMLRLNPSKVVLLVTAEDSSTTKHTIVLFVEQCINENNILYEGGVYVRKPAWMFLHVFFVVPWPTWRCHRGLTIIMHACATRFGLSAEWFYYRGELAPAWHFVVVSCKQTQSHKREPNTRVNSWQHQSHPGVM